MDYKFKNPIQDYKAEQKFIRKFLLIFLFFDLLMVGVVAAFILIEPSKNLNKTESIILTVFSIIIIAILCYCKRFILRKKKLFIRLKHYSGMLQGILFAKKRLPGDVVTLGGGILTANILVIIPFFFILFYVEAAHNLRKLIKGKITEEEIVMQSIEGVKKRLRNQFDEEKTNYYLHEEE